MKWIAYRAILTLLLSAGTISTCGCVKLWGEELSQEEESISVEADEPCPEKELAPIPQENIPRQSCYKYILVSVDDGPVEEIFEGKDMNGAIDRIKYCHYLVTRKAEIHRETCELGLIYLL